MNQQTFIVGRKNATRPCDIELPAAENAVSRQHLELTIGEDGSYWILDTSGPNGTEVFRDGSWHKLTHEAVTADTHLRLGMEYTITINELLRMLHTASFPTPPPPKKKSTCPKRALFRS